MQSRSLSFLYEICKHFLKDEHLKPFSIYEEFSCKETQRTLNEISLGVECEKYLNDLLMQGHKDEVTTVRKNCLSFYVTAAEEIRKRLPVDHIFLSKLNVFSPSMALFHDREKSFKDVSFVAKIIDGFDKDALKNEWIALPLDFSTEKKKSLSQLSFDNMWKEILKCQYPNNMPKYPILKNVLNAVRSLPNSNADPERLFSLLNDLKTKNAIVFRWTRLMLFAFLNQR